jgi:hypothetical protein
VQEIVRLPPPLEVPTVSVVVPLILPEWAVITVVLPFDADALTDARPVLLMLATLLTDDVHVTEDRLDDDPSAFVPVAVNCCV